MTRWTFQQSSCRNCVCCEYYKPIREMVHRDNDDMPVRVIGATGTCQLKDIEVPHGGTCSKFKRMDNNQ